MTSYAGVRQPQLRSFERYRSSLWLLTKRDLRVRYSTNALGYFWSILDPLVMSAIYFFVFTVIFKKSVGEDPYIVYLLTGLLPWMWFNGTISDCSRAYFREAKLIRSTRIPRTIWVNRIVLSKGIEFVAAIPVVAVFAIFSGATLHWQVVYVVLAIVIQAVLTVGLGLIIAPLVVFFRDLERAVKLILRFAFYMTPIIYSAHDLPTHLKPWAALNPMSGILSLYRSSFFPSELSWHQVEASAAISIVLLAIGVWVFSRTERAVLKEI